MKQLVTNTKHRARLTIFAIAVGLTTLCAGCMHHAVRVEPITVAPVRVTMDVNLHVDDARPDGGSAGEAEASPAPAAAAE